LREASSPFLKKRTKKLFPFAFIGISALLVAAGPADPRAATLAALFGDPAHAALNLSPSFLAAVPEARVRSLVSEIEQTHGVFQSVTGAGSEYIIHLVRADVTARIALDESGSITGLRLTRIMPHGATAAQFAAQIEALPGSVSLLLIDGGQTKIDFHSDQPLAVGSAFKLVVLRAVTDAIAAHRLAWDQVVRLDPAWRSFPSGFLQTWPDGTPLTVATLANLMISISDNTAADALAHLVGRDALEKASPRNAPFLTTREMFLLKASAPDWRQLDTAARRARAAATDGEKLPDGLAPPIFPNGPEWYMTAAELCGLLQKLAGLEAFRINPGPADPADWTSVAYKGGSDAGILNVSVFGVGKDGRAVCASATWNDTKALDDKAILTPFAGLLHVAGSR
jgi:beta-lactamase class A